MPSRATSRSGSSWSMTSSATRASFNCNWIGSASHGADTRRISSSETSSEPMNRPWIASSAYSDWRISASSVAPRVVASRVKVCWLRSVSQRVTSTVAAASGYSSDSAFSAMFKAAMGQSPSHFQGALTAKPS